jgi:hypothetical protein
VHYAILENLDPYTYSKKNPKKPEKPNILISLRQEVNLKGPK